MFEPLPSVVRLRREQRGLTQEKLAKMAKVSRGQLIAFERGDQNVSLQFLLKISRALEMTELPLAELHLRPAVPELTVLIAAADAIAAAEAIVTQATNSTGSLSAASQSVKSLLEHAMTLGDAHSKLAAAAGRLTSVPVETLREVAEPQARPRRARDAAPPAAKARARKRG